MNRPTEGLRSIAELFTSRKAAGKFLKLGAILLLNCISQLSYGQFSFELGATVLIAPDRSMNFVDERPTIVNGNMTQQGDTSYYSYDYSGGGVGILAYPKIGVANFAGLNLTVGAPINLGFSGSASSDGESSMSFVIDINAAIDINGGRYNKKNEGKGLFGYYAGIGFGLTNTSNVGYTLNTSGNVNASSDNLNHVNSDEQDPTELLDAKTTGMLLHAGIGQAAFAENIPFIKNLGIRLAYRPSFNSSRLSYTMVSILLHF